MQARYYDPVIRHFYSNDPVDAVEAINRGSPLKKLCCAVAGQVNQV